jgi:hypothetical protein
LRIVIFIDGEKEINQDGGEEENCEKDYGQGF